MIGRIASFFRRLGHDRRGATAIMAGAMMVGLVGVAAVTVDVSYIFYVQRTLQTTTDISALAGAYDINCCVTSTAVATATTYSATGTNKNAKPNLTVTFPTGYPKLVCFTTTGVDCTGVDNANAIVVKQQATVPLFFAKAFMGLFGQSEPTITITATATASAKGNQPVPLDIMMIMDTTASMNGADTVCGAGLTREDCALQGARTLLLELWPSIDKVGLMVFPPISKTTVSREYDCVNNTNPTIEPYNASTSVMTYEIIPLSPADYKVNNTDTTLNTSSNMTKAVRGGATGCKQGLTAVGGQGTFYAGAITAAQAALVSEGTVGTQKVIIILSDGDASSATAPTHANQCRQAVTAAQTAAAAGTWVYSIAYGATNGTSSCSTDTSPYNNACRAMTDIASDPSKFFSDKGGSPVCTSASNPTITSLNQIFKQIGAGLSRVRLLPDNTT